jgi:L-fuconate dehydratase
MCLLPCFCGRIGPEKGVIAIATAAVNNAIWDLFAKARKKPLWKLIVDMSPVSMCLRSYGGGLLSFKWGESGRACQVYDVQVGTFWGVGWKLADLYFRYITDALTPEEAFEMLKAKAAGKAEREKIAREKGYALPKIL